MKLCASRALRRETHPTSYSCGARSSDLEEVMRAFTSIALGFGISVAAAWGLAATETPVIQWTRQFGTTGGSSDVAFAVAVDVSGNAYVVGQVLGAFAGQTSAGGSDAFLRKYDP